jgi:hypothetical protein
VTIVAVQNDPGLCSRAPMAGLRVTDVNRTEPPTAARDLEIESL